MFIGRYDSFVHHNILLRRMIHFQSLSLLVQQIHLGTLILINFCDSFLGNNVYDGNDLFLLNSCKAPREESHHCALRWSAPEYSSEEECCRWDHPCGQHDTFPQRDER